MEINSINYTIAKNPVSFGNIIGHQNFNNALNRMSQDSYSSSYSTREPEIIYTTTSMDDFKRFGGKLSPDRKKAVVHNFGFLTRKYTGYIDDVDKETGLGHLGKYLKGKMIAEKEIEEDKITVRKYNKDGELKETFVRMKNPERNDNLEPVFIETRYTKDGTDEIKYSPTHVPGYPDDVVKYFNYYSNGNLRYGPLDEDQLQRELYI